ncbi:MAG: hypothetical protein GY708_00710 [Actinomycetia bacterium]|nr:hypothetical protein [Actinomycetes bacterium]MCP4959647.1 hypothetical protein [Actinomycetes bacterium]
MLNDDNINNWRSEAPHVPPARQIPRPLSPSPADRGFALPGPKRAHKDQEFDEPLARAGQQPTTRHRANQTTGPDIGE